MLGCRLRMTREEIKVKATYHSLYGFFSPLNVPLSMQTKRDFTIERSLEQTDSERQARWKEASRSVKVQAPARAGTNTTRGLEGRGVTVDAECSRVGDSEEDAPPGSTPGVAPGHDSNQAEVGREPRQEALTLLSSTLQSPLSPSPAKSKSSRK